MDSLKKADYVAKRTGFSKQRIYEMVRLGLFGEGVVIRFNRTIRFSERALEEWLAKGGSSQTPIARAAED